MKAGNLKINPTSKWTCCSNQLMCVLCCNCYITVFIRKQTQLLFSGMSALSVCVFVWVCVCVCSPSGQWTRRYSSDLQSHTIPPWFGCLFFAHICVLTWWSKMPRADTMSYLGMLSQQGNPGIWDSAGGREMEKLHNKGESNFNMHLNCSGHFCSNHVKLSSQNSMQR